jgi:hypothetical protein
VRPHYVVCEQKSRLAGQDEDKRERAVRCERVWEGLYTYAASM